MKYWWLEKYRNFKIIQINELADDIDYFLTMPRNYETQYQQIKEKDIDVLKEEELLILFKKIIDTKNIKDNSLNIIISKLLQVPDNSFPPSDYDLKQMLDEIKNIKNNIPDKSKIENNNIAICYHCLNIFYVDKIKSINKNNLCLCPYCLKTTLYFDNDYIPMNYTFIKLAYLYYHISSLGCTFSKIQKIANRDINTYVGKEEKNSISFFNIFSNDKISPIDEKIIYKNLYQELMQKEKDMLYQSDIYLKELPYQIENRLLEIILTVLLEVLSNTIYLKKIRIIFEDKRQQKNFLYLLKTIINFY